MLRKLHACVCPSSKWPHAGIEKALPTLQRALKIHTTETGNSSEFWRERGRSDEGGGEGKVGERDCKQDNQCLFKYKLCGSKVGGEEESGRLLQLIAQLTFV